MLTLSIQSSHREELIDITGWVNRLLAEQGEIDGLCCLFVPHTTAGIIVNEHADPTVAADVLQHLRQLVPATGSYRHLEGNSDAHIKAVLCGSSLTLPVAGGRLALGTWQGVFFCEFDGPRRRQVQVHIIKS
ncbi:MAG: secondary thiamine-phosphate synthase enzyme YjbQ [Bacillota bacterium]|uniref:secondary thiamine-phosphate synthase enzyme YjbQ n=1 Tax=Desulfurispora thermophila TaxID=265470 RepID=UPI000363FCEE|nr:secondary thiamine-phosphate synthase enzyme YjbQ [Desulfurispora thermophila]